MGFSYFIFRPVFVFLLVKIITQGKQLQIGWQQIYQQQIYLLAVSLLAVSVSTAINKPFPSYIQMIFYFSACKNLNAGTTAADMLAAADFLAASISTAVDRSFSYHIQTHFHIFACKNCIFDCKAGNSEAIGAGQPAMSRNISRYSYQQIYQQLQVSLFNLMLKPFYVFLLVKIVFLIIKLVMQRQEIQISQQQVDIQAGVYINQGTGSYKQIFFISYYDQFLLLRL